LFGGVAAVEAGAQIYRCQDTYGNVTYQQNPCDPRATARRLDDLNEPASSLAQQTPSKQAIDGCIGLHGLPVDSPDFQLHSAHHAPAGSGSWEVVVTGLAGKGDARKEMQTLRCPVAGNGALNAELFRSRRQLGVALQRRESVEKAEISRADRSRRGADDNERPENNAPGNNLAKAGERKFLAARGAGATKREVRELLGDPDSIDTVAETCIAPYTRMPYVCRVTTWIYKPAPLDQQTRTTITFNDDDVMTNVVRNIEY
jgi:hypothetical protein